MRVDVTRIHVQVERVDRPILQRHLPAFAARVAAVGGKALAASERGGDLHILPVDAECREIELQPAEQPGLAAQLVAPHRVWTEVERNVSGR